MKNAVATDVSWFDLSRLPNKRQVYSEDKAFSRAYRIYIDLLVSGNIDRSFLWDAASVLLKPDAIFSRKAHKIIPLLMRKDYEISTAKEVCFDSKLVKLFWEHSLGRLSDERVECLTKIMQLSPSAYMLVKRHSYDNVPASVSITHLKGQAAPNRRAAGELRYDLDSPSCAMLSLIHSSDEPADVLREMGLLFDDDGIHEILSAFGSEDSELAASTLFRDLYAKTACWTFDFSAALDVLRTSVSESDAAPFLKTSCEHIIARIADGELGIWNQARHLLNEAGASVPPLTALTIEAWNAPLHREVKSQPFPSCEREHWATA